MDYQNRLGPISTSRTIVCMIVLFTVLLTACGSSPTQEAPPQGPTPDPNLPVSVVPSPQPGQPSATADYNTVIYSGPGTNYVVYSAFLGGKQAVVVGKSENGLWWAIDVPVAASKVGWVSDAWVTVEGADGVPVLATPPVPPSTELVPPGPDDPQATTIANTYVRTGPGDNYPAYGIADAGKKAWVLGKSTNGQWLVVRLDPQVVGAGYGWVALAYIQAVNIDNVQVVKESTPPDVEAPPAAPPDSPSATALDYINVRTGPGMGYSVLFAAPPGASGVVTGRSADNEWWQVEIPTKYAANGLGWVSQYYVTTANTENVPVVDAPPLPPFPEEPPTSITCALDAQNPADDTVMAPGSLFEASWTLRNTGSESWESDVISVRYMGSLTVPLHQGADLYNPESDVGANQSYTFTVPMIVPSEPGRYGELWGIFGDSDSTLCQFWLTIESR